jgi:2-polyprenyl-3-methyl-5-hydroxy-6-metoxy-1,4-benzoquinol methylase
LADLPFPELRFDAIFMVDFLEHVREPEQELSLARDRLEERGVVVISTPNLDSLTRSVMRFGWSQYREEHLTYFSRLGLSSLLERTGYSIIDTRRTRKVMTLSYLYRQLQTYRHPVLTPVSSVLWRSLPFIRDRLIPMTLGEMTIVACRAAP